MLKSLIVVLLQTKEILMTILQLFVRGFQLYLLILQSKTFTTEQILHRFIKQI